MYAYILMIPLILFVIIFEIKREKSNKYFDILTFVNVLFIFLYGIIPIASIFNFEHLPFWSTHIDFSQKYVVLSNIYIYIFYTFMILGYYIYNKIPIFTNIYVKITRSFKAINLVHFTISLFMLFIFTVSIGGINEFFTTNTLYRGGHIEISEGAFTRNLILFIPIFSHLIFARLITIKFNTVKYYTYSLMLLITFILSFAIYFNRASRLSTIFYIVLFLIIYFLIKKRINIFLLVSSGFIFVFLLLYGKRLFNYFLVGEVNFTVNEEIGDIFFKEFSFPFINSIVAAKDGFLIESYRFYIDILIGILNLIPTSILPISLPKHDVILNTEKYLNLSGIPIDIVSFNYYSLGILGLVIGGLVFGYIINLFENLFSNKSNIYVAVIYAHILKFVVLLIPYTSPTNSLKSNFNLAIFLLCFLLLNRLYNNFKGKDRSQEIQK